MDSPLQQFPNPELRSQPLTSHGWNIEGQDNCLTASIKKNQHTRLRPYRDEVQKFNEPLIPRKDDHSKYWKEHGAALSSYPVIQVSPTKSALQHLLIPATEVINKRMFCTVENTVTSQRQSLKPSHVEQHVFLHDNL